MTTPTPRWTAEMLALATSAFEDWALSRTEPDDLWDKPAEAAKAVLTALADAGVLLPVGGETRQEWGRPTIGGKVRPCATLERNRCATQPEQHRRRDVTSWPDGSVHVGPWREVTDDPA